MVLRLVISSSTEAGTFCASSVSVVPAASRLFRDEPISPMGAGEGIEEDVEAVADFSKVIEVELYDTPGYVDAGGVQIGQPFGELPGPPAALQANESCEHDENQTVGGKQRQHADDNALEDGWNEFGGDVEIYHNFCLIPRI